MIEIEGEVLGRGGRRRKEKEISGSSCEASKLESSELTINIYYQYYKDGSRHRYF
jgi:hypothetical protein